MGALPLCSLGIRASQEVNGASSRRVPGQPAGLSRAPRPRRGPRGLRAPRGGELPGFQPLCRPAWLAWLEAGGSRDARGFPEPAGAWASLPPLRIYSPRPLRPLQLGRVPPRLCSLRSGSVRLGISEEGGCFPITCVCQTLD